MRDRPSASKAIDPTAREHIAVIAGSGMGGLGQAFPPTSTMTFEELGIGPCQVSGHAGEFRECSVDGRRFTLVLGRRHWYENALADIERIMVELATRGVTDLLVMSAAGSTRRTSPPGEVVVIHGVIDLQNRARRPDPSDGGARTAVDAHLTRRVESALTRAGLSWSRGTIASGCGPAYETPAEVDFLQRLGADLASMSSAPEISLANNLGMRVAALGLLTNPATGIAGSSPDHDEVLSQALQSSGPLTAVVAQLVANNGVMESGRSAV